MEGVVTHEKPFLHRFADSPQFPLAMMALGGFVAWAESLLMLVQGESIENAIWPQAVRTLSWTFILRENVLSIAFLSALFLGFVSTLPFNITGDIVSTSQFKQSSFTDWRCFRIMDHLRFDGLPLHPWSLSHASYNLRRGSPWFSLAVRGPPGLPDSTQDWKGKTKTVLHVATVFLAAWLVMPGIPALIGIAPSPPLAPTMGYGAEAGPFDRTTSTLCLSIA